MKHLLNFYLICISPTFSIQHSLLYMHHLLYWLKNFNQQQIPFAFYSSNVFMSTQQLLAFTISHLYWLIPQRFCPVHYRRGHRRKMIYSSILLKCFTAGLGLKWRDTSILTAWSSLLGSQSEPIRLLCFPSAPPVHASRKTKSGGVVMPISMKWGWGGGAGLV